MRSARQDHESVAGAQVLLESKLMNCTTVHWRSETVFETLITDVLTTSTQEGRHSRTTYETWIRHFCADPNELSAKDGHLENG